MADSNIQNLDEATSIGSNDLFVLQQGLKAKKLQAEVLTEFVDRNIVDVSLTTIAANQQGYCDYDAQTGELELYVPRGTTGGQIDSIAKTSTSGLVDTYTVTVKDGAGTTVGTYTFTVTNGQDGSGAVDSVNGEVGTVVLDAGDINVDETATTKQTISAKLTSIDSGKQDKITVTTATLAVASWSNKSITVSVSGVTSSNNVIVTPSPASFTAYTQANIYCSEQADGTLTFICSETPTEAITVNAMIVG